MYQILIFYSATTTIAIFILLLKTKTKNTHVPAMRVAQSGMQILNHTFKNKLNTISMLLEIIKDKSIGDSVTEEIKVMEQSVLHLQGMVDKIKERTGKIVFQEQTHSLIDIFEHAISQVNQSLPQNITIHVNKNVGGRIRCDFNFMSEVFHCIIQNSIESFSEDDDGQIEIYIDKLIPGFWLSICVKDNGCGMNKDTLKHIAEPYFSTKSNAVNFGLGMSFCFNVMRAANSGLKIKSELGKGTTLILSFNPSKVIAYPQGANTK